MENNNEYIDKTEEWEKEFSKRNSPKLKFPIKVIDDSIDLSLIDDFPIAEIEEVKLKKENKKIKIIDLNKKEAKNKLF